MARRLLELSALSEYIEKIDKETTLLLQNLQWDHKHLLESPMMVSCKYVVEHRIPLQSVKAHEKRCFLKQHGYSEKDDLLPDAADPNAQSVVKLSKQDVKKIIDAAVASDPSFKRGSGEAEPLTVERLQHVYSADERRAIYDAVVAAAPVCHDLTELALSGGPQNASGSRQSKSRAEVLAELRDMKRRRTRYRVAAPTAHYSDVLRDVIKTQMELYAESKGIYIKTEYGPKTFVSLQDKTTVNENNVANTVIKQERISPDIRRLAEKSKNRDSKQRTEHVGRKTDTNKRRHHYDIDYNEKKKRFKDVSHDKYREDKRRYDDGPSKRDNSYKFKDAKTNHERFDGKETEKSNSTRDSERCDRGRFSKSNDRHYNDSCKASKHNSNYDRRRTYREDSSNGSKYDYKKKHDEYERSNRLSNKHQEDERRRRRSDNVKEEEDDYYESFQNDREKRKRNS